jgi:hypothetical protein
VDELDVSLKMEPLSTALAFGTVVQLLCNYRQEVAGRKNAELTDFLTWLAYHKFEDVKDLITNSSQIQIELQQLLQEDLSEINSKLDVLNNAVVAIGQRLDGFSGLVAAVGAESDSLSDQAVAVLSEFANSESTKLGLFLNINPPQCALFPEGRGFGVRDARFLADDIEALEAFDFIRLVDHNKSGNPLYALTRKGADFARKAAEQQQPNKG